MAGALSWLGKLRGSATEAAERQKADKLQRAAALNILYPNEVQGKEWDANRALLTTMGGKLRPITRDDLVVFRKTVKGLQKDFKVGIRARQVIDLSTPQDRARSNEQIRMAVPVAAKDGRVRFMTNAGKNSNVQRHNVTVEFMSFTAAAVAGRASPKQMAAWLRKEPLKFDCDCGRHRYWFRYISTIGGFNAGRAETGYPKETNPGLHGVGCKHVLRVMAEIESSAAILGFLTKLVEQARGNDDVTAKIRVAQDEAEALAIKQNKRPRSIDTSVGKETIKAIRQSKRARVELSKAVKVAPVPKKLAPSTKRIALSASAKEAAALLAKELGISVSALLASAKKG